MIKMAKKKKAKKKGKKSKPEVKAEKIQVENVPEVKINEGIPEEQQKQEVPKTEKEIKREFLAKSLTLSATYIVNQTVLKKKQKITKEEMAAIQFGDSMADLILFYYPDFHFDHPLLVAGTSLSLLIATCSSKEVLPEFKDDKKGSSKSKDKPKDGEVDGKIRGEPSSSGLGKGRSPYADLKTT